MSFGSTSGNISNCIKLIVKFKKAYSGSSPELQGVIDDLEGFTFIRDQIRAFATKFPEVPFADILQQQANRLDSATARFQKEVARYEPSLGESSLYGALRKIPAKAHYAIFSGVKDLKIAFQQQWNVLLNIIASQIL
jgi:hypothetical protein